MLVYTIPVLDRKCHKPHPLAARLASPGFRLALGKLPGSGAGLASLPTMSRWENAPATRELARMMQAMICIYCATNPAPGSVGQRRDRYSI